MVPKTSPQAPGDAIFRSKDVGPPSMELVSRTEDVVSSSEESKYVGRDAIFASRDAIFRSPGGRERHPRATALGYAEVPDKVVERAVGVGRDAHLDEVLELFFRPHGVAPPGRGVRE